MSNSWTGEVDDNGDDEPKNGFVAKLQKHIDSGSVPEIAELDLLEGIDEVEDETMLQQAWRQLDGSGYDEKLSIVERRMDDLDVSLPPTESEQATLDESSDDEDEGEGSEEAEAVVTRLDEEDDPDGEPEEETAPEQTEAGSGPPEPASAMSPQEAADLDRRWKVMVFGPPKLFKTHFCFTMPEPIAFIDLEGKADDIAGKFADKEIRIWQPKRMTAEPDTKFRRARKALDEAFEWLDWYRENEGRTGTIVVDSMSQLWEWAQIHHKMENYPMKDTDEVELSANFHSSQESDWAIVKEYHNSEFRERICDSPYHFCWTAMERLDFEEQLDGDSDARIMEPRGETNNVYKVDTIIHARSDPDRDKVGDLIGSNVTDNRFVGLRKPTFPKLQDAIEAIQRAEAEQNGQTRAELAKQIDAEAVIEHDPQRYRSNQ